jgi:hypothetical protein
VNLNGKPLTYLYQATPVEIKDVMTRRTVGTITATIALGEREHQSILDPNAPPPPVIPTPPPAAAPAPPPPAESAKPQRRGRAPPPPEYSDYSDYSEEEDEVDWETEAVKHGWVKPGSTGPWKEKALKKGWTPPVRKAFYTTGTECDLLEHPAKADISVQVRVDEMEYLDEYLPANGDEPVRVEAVKSDIEALFNRPAAPLSVETHAPIYSSGSDSKPKRKAKLTVQQNAILSMPPERDSDDELSDVDDHMVALGRSSAVEEKKQKPVQKTAPVGESSGLSDSSEVDFRPADGEPNERSELILPKSKKSSGSGSDRAKPSAAVPAVLDDDSPASDIFQSPGHNPSDSSSPEGFDPEFEALLHDAELRDAVAEASTGSGDSDEIDLSTMTAQVLKYSGDQSSKISKTSKSSKRSKTATAPVALPDVEEEEEEEEEEDIGKTIPLAPVEEETIRLAVDEQAPLRSAPEEEEEEEEESAGIGRLAEADEQALNESMKGLALSSDSEANDDESF